MNTKTKITRQHVDLTTDTIDCIVSNSGQKDNLTKLAAIYQQAEKDRETGQLTPEITEQIHKLETELRTRCTDQGRSFYTLDDVRYAIPQLFEDPNNDLVADITQRIAATPRDRLPEIRRHTYLAYINSQRRRTLRQRYRR